MVLVETVGLKLMAVVRAAPGYQRVEESAEMERLALAAAAAAQVEVPR